MDLTVILGVLLLGLRKRILRVVEEEALGYGSLDDFVLAALRSELKEAELASYWLKEEGGPS